MEKKKGFQTGGKRFPRYFIISWVCFVRNVQKKPTLTCSRDSLEAVWDGFPVSSNHKSHCFRPQGTESGPAWRSPTWWLQTTTERQRQREGGKEWGRGRERGRVKEFWLYFYGNNTAMFVEDFWTSYFMHDLQRNVHPFLMLTRNTFTYGIQGPSYIHAVIISAVTD